MNLNDLDITKINGVSTKRAQLYKKLSIENVFDLIYHFPKSYIDLTDIKLVKETSLFDTETIEAKLFNVYKPKYLTKGRTLFEADVIDRENSILKLVFFNNPYSIKSLKEDEFYLFHGKVDGNLIYKKMINPKIVNAKDIGLNGVYKLTKGLTSNMIRTNVSYILDNYEIIETLPQDILDKYKLIPLKSAIKKLHFPKSSNDVEVARRRIVFEELLIWQLSLLFIKKGNDKSTNITLNYDDLTDFIDALPFTLTQGQLSAIDDIVKDCKENISMNRLICGDVGSGKTVVSAAALYLFAKSSYQGAMMAPTELLARQHFNTIKNLLSPLFINVELLVGSLTNKEKECVQKRLKDGEIDIIIGTQTLFQEKTNFKNLGIVITDEQHRFGVNQRMTLKEKGNNPHVLVMSATPIPRSLALIIYGDLDVSTIETLPKGRIPIDTFFISSKKRMRAYEFIKKHLDEKKQAYIVCPMVEDNERNTQAVNSYAENLMKTVFKNYNVATLHGKLKNDEKEKTMNAFNQGKIDLLISTTVIEVGIDVKNAVIMMIENAELFGLSQLHQLRGRVGRGNLKSYCILVSDLKTQDNVKRLKTMCETSDGFEIAKTDLALRGPGDFFGNRQHGLPRFKLADIYLDMNILNLTKEEAKTLFNNDNFKVDPKYKYIKNKVSNLIDNNIL